MAHPMERLGRVNHKDLGKCVKVRTWAWEGPSSAGEVGKWNGMIELFPIDQRMHSMHQKHPTGYAIDADGELTGRRFSHSPSCSWYSELCRYAQFKWRSRKVIFP